MTKLWFVLVAMLLTACGGAGVEVPVPSPAGAPTSPAPKDAGAIAFIRLEAGGATEEGVVPSASLMLLPVDGRPREIGPAAQAPPAWSPDGSRLAFLGRGGIWILADGEDPRRLTTCDPSSCVGDGPPAWSPDGRSVAFASDRDDGTGLWVIPSAGGDATLLASDLTLQGSPSWSPDGSTIAAIVAEGEGHVAMIDAASGEVRDTLSPTGLDLGDTVTWSPDGATLLVAAAEARAEGVYVLQPDGSGVRRITTCPDPACGDLFPGWSPDGTRVLFTRGRCDGPGGDCYSGDLFSIPLQGTTPEPITRGPALDCCAAWQPVIAS